MSDEHTILYPEARPFEGYDACRNHIIQNYAWVGSDQPMFLFIIDKLFQLETDVKGFQTKIDDFEDALREAESSGKWRDNFRTRLSDIRKDMNKFQQRLDRLTSARRSAQTKQAMQAAIETVAQEETAE